MACSRILVFSVVAVLGCANFASAQFGAQMSSVGAINRSMGGASTAAPLDTLGAFLWNPATISALPTSADMSVELLFPHSKIASSAGPFSGSTDSNAGVFPLPDMGIVYQPEDDSALTYGLGILTTGGFGCNFPGSATNPILTAPPPTGFGFGSMFAQYVMTQIVPTVSYQATERLSIGFSPIVDLANLSVDPGIFAAPNANGYPTFNNGEYQWGAGFQVGAFYQADNYWNFGASFKSQQWFNDFEFRSLDQNGAPRTLKVPVNGPMIVSVGTSYAGIERLLLAADVRYIDYHNTTPFNASGVSATGAVNGLGWSSIFALSTGAQYEVTDAVSVRAGYSYNTNPIGSDNAFVNAATPLIIQHGIYCGGSWKVTERLKLSLAYMHLFANSVSGPWVGPSGPVAGTSVTTTSSADSVIASASFLF